jgi:phage gpG-like protein
MSVTLAVELEGADRALVALERFADFPREELLEGLGGLLDSQHRRRIESEHTTPAGRPFAPVIRGGTPLYESGRHLRDAFYYEVSDPQVRVSNNFIGAGVLNAGAVITPQSAKALHFTINGVEVFAQRVVIPPRPFMGISAENQFEILEAVEAFIAGLDGGGE